MAMLLVTLPMNTITSTSMLMLTMLLMLVVPVREVAMMLPWTLDPLPLLARGVSTRS